MKAVRTEVIITPRRLVPGDRVRFISPGSPPDRSAVERCRSLLEGWGLVVEIGIHAFDEQRYLAGLDEHRLADLNDALRDPGVRAIFATRGGKGAYRIANRIDIPSARANRPFLVGFSDVTVLHLALFRGCGLVGLHGPMMSFGAEMVGPQSVEALRSCLMTTTDLMICADSENETEVLTTSGIAQGPLIGGNLDTLANSAGWALPSLDGAILFLEGATMGLGQIDRQLTMLRNAGHLDGVAGIAVGRFTQCGRHGDWTAIDVLRDHMRRLSVPVLGGIPAGHGRNPVSLPIGAIARLDCSARTLTMRGNDRQVDP